MVRRADGVLVGAPAPGDEQDEAEADQPGAERLRGLGGAVHEGLRRLARPGPVSCRWPRPPTTAPGAEQQGRGGDDADEQGAAVGERGRARGPGDLPGAGGVAVPPRPYSAAHLGRLSRGASSQVLPAEQRDREQQERPAATGITDACQVSSTGGPAMTAPRPMPGVPGPVEPVGDALGDAAGHHAAERAGEHRDGGAAEAVQSRCAACGAPAVQRCRAGDDREGDDQRALGEGEAAEGRVAGQACPSSASRGVTSRRTPAARASRARARQRQPVTRCAVEPAVEPVSRCGPGGTPPRRTTRPRQRRGCLQQPAEDVEQGRPPGARSWRAAAAATRRGDGQEARRRCARRAAGRRAGGRTRSRAGRARSCGRPARSSGFGACGRGRRRRWDSYALQVRWERYQRRPTSAVGHQGGEGEPAARLRSTSRRRAPATGSRARTGRRRSGRARALPGGQVEGDLAGRGDEQHGQGQRDEPDQQRRTGAPRGCGRVAAGRIQWARLTTMNGQQQQPQGAGAVAGGEVGPARRPRGRARPGDGRRGACSASTSSARR